jgi:Pyridoxamine 5'-phosphate oxidase
LRDTATRKKDVLARLEMQGHYWLATAQVGGGPHVIAVSGLWEGSEMVVTTMSTSKTARNMAMNPLVVLAGGDPSDAIVIRAQVIESRPAADSPRLLEEWKTAMGWDPTELGDWMFYRLRPTRIQAFRGYGEVKGRDVMIRGRWVE